MKGFKEAKASLKIVIFFILLISIIIIPVLVNNFKIQNKENFPKYNDIDIDKNKLNNTDDYNSIRRQLESDQYFAKASTMMEFTSDNYSSASLRELLWYFIFNYEVSNDKYFFYTDSKRGVYCLNEKNLVKGFNELYDIDISNDLYLLPGYYQYLFLKNKGYCLYFDHVAEEYDNDIRVAVERIAMYGTTITTDVYVYEYYNSYSEKDKTCVKNLEISINNKDYNTASQIVKLNLKGTVTHKQLQFKMNSRGKFFKYKILSSKKLEY